VVVLVGPGGWKCGPATGRAGNACGAVGMSTDHPTDRRPSDGSTGGSRPSMNNRHGPREGLSSPNLAIDADDMVDGVAFRPISVEPGRELRDEAVHQLSDGVQARPWYAVVSEWRDWYDGYLRMHIEYEGPDGKAARTRLENSYQPRYGKRYYAKLKDMERGINREYESLRTAILTFTASNRNDEGGFRCPADHMRDIMDGYDAARKQLHKVLDGYTWEYARVWEPHESGYGHLHMAVFIDDGDELEAGDFAPVMESHVRNCDPAGWDAHQPWGDSVSLNDNVENLGSYISEYIGIFGEEALDRPISEQAFYATTWATGTRRVDFSNGAHELINREQFRRETGLRPEDRGGSSYDEWKGGEGVQGPSDNESSESDAQSVTEESEKGAEGGGWSVRSICTVRSRRPSYSDPTTGGVDTTPIDGRRGVDIAPEVE